jgi:rhodanese-related sulfurtransferase
MSRRFYFAIAFAGAFAITAPTLAQAPAPAPAPAQAQAPAWPPIVNEYVLTVRKTIKTVDMAGYLAAVKDPKGALIVDVREPAEYAADHVPGSINIPRGLLEYQIYKAMGYPNKVDTNRAIYVQCASGGRATLATAALKEIGFTHPIAVIINWYDWVGKDYPNEK